MPKISIIMGVYNCSSTVKDSIKSILDQTFTDWEFIICDDGSTDDTARTVKEYALSDDRIKLIRNSENRGLSYTLNKCIENASGEYCARMDGDDISFPDRFEKQVDYLDKHPEIGFVATRMARHDEKGTYSFPHAKSIKFPDKKDLIRSSPFAHATIMIRNSAYTAVGGYRDLKTTLGVEDYDLWFRLYNAGIKGCILKETLYSMFDGRSAASRRSFRRRYNEFWVRKEGYKLIKAPVRYYFFALKPLILGLIPQKLYIFLRKKAKLKA